MDHKISLVRGDISEAKVFLENDTFNDLMVRTKTEKVDEQLMKEVMMVPKINIQL